MNYCCDKCGALVKAQDLSQDTDPRTGKKSWICKACADKLKDLRDRIDEAEENAAH